MTQTRRWEGPGECRTYRAHPGSTEELFKIPKVDGSRTTNEELTGGRLEVNTKSQGMKNHVRALIRAQSGMSNLIQLSRANS